MGMTSTGLRVNLRSALILRRYYNIITSEEDGECHQMVTVCSASQTLHRVTFLFVFIFLKMRVLYSVIESSRSVLPLTKGFSENGSIFII